MAFVCFERHPNVPAIPPNDWPSWLYNIYRLPKINARNSLWIHFTGWDNRVKMYFMKILLQEVFNSDHHLEYVLIVVPPGIYILEWLNYLGTRIKAPGKNMKIHWPLPCILFFGKFSSTCYDMLLLLCAIFFFCRFKKIYLMERRSLHGPKIKKKHRGNKFNIWSCTCSLGFGVVGQSTLHRWVAILIQIFVIDFEGGERTLCW